MSENQEANAPLGFPARLAGVFTAPSMVFEEIKRRPTWLAALLAVTLATAALNTLVLWSETGEKVVRQQFQEAVEKSGREVPPEAIDTQIKVYRYMGPAMVIVVFPVLTLALSGLVYLIFSIVLGGEGTFRQTFSAYSHASLIGIVGAVVATGMIFLKGNAKSSTAVTAFLPFLEENSFVYRFCQGLDLFVIWQLVVLSIGMGIIGRMSTRKSATAIFSVYLAIWLLITVVRQAMS
jgi:hypothetical protein